MMSHESVAMSQPNMPHRPVLAIGVMTGNSLDGIDLVLSAFHQDGRIEDICSHFRAFEPQFYNDMRALQSCVAAHKGDMTLVNQIFEYPKGAPSDLKTLQSLHDSYLHQVHQAIEELINQRRSALGKAGGTVEQVDVIGFHGQTLDHNPASRGGDQDSVYTVQLGSGQQLANLTGITVVHDFRSDDVMAGGEGAPFAPGHNRNLTKALGKTALVFCNAGNTGNLAIVSCDSVYSNNASSYRALGWDAGPCNHYPDTLMRRYFDQACDHDGKLGAQGKINLDVLNALFHRSTLTLKSENFLQISPPKSSDPSFYAWLPELDDERVPVADKVRTCEFFSAYCLAHSLSLAPASVTLPKEFILFGGGWKNPIVRQDFEQLIQHQHPELSHLSEEMAKPLLELNQRFLARQEGNDDGSQININASDELGFDAQVMEARLMADMAVCRLRNQPFTDPDMTGVSAPTVCGMINFPNADPSQASSVVKTLLNSYNSLQSTEIQKRGFVDTLWSRASAGWQTVIS